MGSADQGRNITLTINLTPQSEDRLVKAAKQSGVAPSEFAQRLIEQHLPEIPTSSVADGDFGGKTIGDIAGDLLGSVTGGLGDAARHPEKYMDGFGEPRWPKGNGVNSA